MTKLFIGMSIWCYLTLTMELPGYSEYNWEEVYALCYIRGIDQPSIPKNIPKSIFVDCETSVLWLVKDNKDFVDDLKYWTRYERGVCYETL